MIEKKKRKSRVNTGILTFALAAVIILGLLFAGLVLPDKTFSETEKRSLSQFPKLSFESLVSGSFMDDLETYLSDQFPGRDFAVNIAAAYDSLTEPDISNDVLKGRKGWLFQLFGGSGYSADTEQNLVQFLASCDAESTIMLVPDSVSVAEESQTLSALVPEGAVTYNQRSWYQKFSAQIQADIAAAGAAEKIKMADPFDALTAAWENGTDVYYKTDHHWTTYGAREAYLQLKDVMQLSGNAENDALLPACRNFNGSLISKSGYRISSADEIDILQPEENITTVVYYEEEQETEAGVYSMDGLSGNDPYEVFFGGNHALVRISSDLNTGRKLLVLKDSYANALVPFLIPDFDSIVMVDPRYYNGDIGQLAKSEGFTDVLVLYNINTFCEDQALSMILREAGQ